MFVSFWILPAISQNCVNLQGFCWIDENFENVLKNDSLSPITCFYACGPNEINKETTIDNGERIGSLTYAFIKAINETSTSNTYNFLFDKIKFEMTRRVPIQTPQYEGVLNIEIFNGKLTPQREYFLVDKIINREKLLIKAGQLQGISKGSLISIYPPDSDTAGIIPYAQGVVSTSNLSYSEVRLSNTRPKLNYGLIGSAWV
jgi:hypothetical protein